LKRWLSLWLFAGAAFGALSSGSSFAQLALVPATLPGGSVGSPYVHTLGASGGTPPYSTPTVVSGSAPPGTTTSPGFVSFNFTPVGAVVFSFSALPPP
jgi:hypothetical protein